MKQIIILVLLLSSCTSSKKVIKETNKVNRETVEVALKDVKTTSNELLIENLTSTSIKIIPIDNKPLIIIDKKGNKTILSNAKEIVVSTYKKEKKVAKKVDSVVKGSIKKDINEKIVDKKVNKDVKRTNYTLLYILLIILALYLIKRKINGIL